jgi:hypothetical protein
MANVGGRVASLVGALPLDTIEINPLRDGSPDVLNAQAVRDQDKEQHKENHP